MVAGMVTRDVVREEMAGLGLWVVAGLGGGVVEVVWLKDLWLMAVLEKVKEMVVIWRSFGVVVK